MAPRLDQFLKQAFERWEAQTAEQWTKLLRDPVFLQMAWRSLALGFSTQQQFNALVTEWWQLWRVPTRDAQQALQHEINRLQLMIDDLALRLDDLADTVEQEDAA